MRVWPSHSAYGDRLEAVTAYADVINRIYGLRANTYYGHDWVLASYCGLRHPLPILGHVQHGWTTGIREVPLQEDHAMARLGAKWLFWSPRAKGALPDDAKRRLQGVTLMGSPFIYLAEHVRGTRPTPGRETYRTLFYPLHSHEEASVSVSHHELARAIEWEFGSSTTVCLYYFDYADDGVRMAYAERGFRVITHGRSKFDKRYLWNQYSELLRHEGVYSNDFGTALFYGAYLSRSVGITGPRSATTDDGSLDHGLQTMADHLRVGYSGSQARSLATIELGAEYLRSPSGLRNLLGWDVASQLRIGRAASVRGIGVLGRRLGGLSRWSSPGRE